jgi:hypothetical protein
LGGQAKLDAVNATRVRTMINLNDFIVFILFNLLNSGQITAIIIPNHIGIFRLKLLTLNSFDICP